MQLIKRKVIDTIQPVIINIKAIGFNTNEVLTISCNDDNGEELLINLNGKDLRKLRDFLNKLR